MGMQEVQGLMAEGRECIEFTPLEELQEALQGLGPAAAETRVAAARESIRSLADQSLAVTDLSKQIVDCATDAADRFLQAARGVQGVTALGTISAARNFKTGCIEMTSLTDDLDAEVIKLRDILAKAIDTIDRITHKQALALEITQELGQKKVGLLQYLDENPIGG